MEYEEYAILTFFAPPLCDNDFKNECLRRKVRESGLFGRDGTMYRSREIYDTYRHGGAFPMFFVQDDPVVVARLLQGGRGTLNKHLLGEGIETRQGVYRRTACVHLPGYNEHQEQQRLSYIVLAFKTLEPQPNKQLLDNWKIWTGARAILQDFGERVPVQEVTFYVRQTPADFDVFGYIVLMSFETSDEVRQWVLYYIQRLRVERWFGFTSLYAVAPNFNNSTTTNSRQHDDK